MKRVAMFFCTTLLLMIPVLSAIPARAAFPGANGDIVFNRVRHGQVDLWTVDTGGTVTRLTSTLHADEGLADWNSTGTAIAYSRCGTGKFSNCDIWMMDADGSIRTRLTSTDVAQETWPTWSPDGSMIAYTSNASDEFQDIWVMDADGQHQTRLTLTVGFDAFPEWSPDGAHIAFTSDRSALDDIWVIDAEGADPTRLTVGGNKVDERPDWSPDGAHLTFSRDGNIWSMDADGENEVQLTTSKRDETAPTYSPNGLRIAFNRADADGRFGVWVMPADGTAPPNQRTTGAFDFAPDWQPLKV